MPAVFLRALLRGVIAGAVTAGILAGIAYGFALFNRTDREMLAGKSHQVLMTVTGNRPSSNGCRSGRYSEDLPGNRWEVTWTDDGVVHHGSLLRCRHAPTAGTKIHDYADDAGDAGGDTRGHLIAAWLGISGFVALFITFVVAFTRSPAGIRRAEQQREQGPL